MSLKGLLKFNKDRVKKKEPEPSFLDKLQGGNIFPFLQTLLEQGWIIDPKTDKVTPLMSAVDWKRDWLGVNPDPDRGCNLHFKFFQYHNIVPERCLSCWKVCVRMPTLIDLFKMRGWQMKTTNTEEGKEMWCKCGIEKRKWVHGNYGGYFYCESEKQGLERYEQVIKAMKENGIQGKAVLKRGCTEMELKCGNFDDFEKNKTAATKHYEKRIYDAINDTQVQAKQPDWLKQDIYLRWIEWAYDRGDATALAFNNGEVFYPPYKTYHKEVTDGTVKRPE